MYRRVIALSAALVGVLAGSSLALAQESLPNRSFKAFRSDGKNLFMIMPNGKWARVGPQAQQGRSAELEQEDSPHATRFTSQQRLGDYYIGLALNDVSDTLRSQLNLDDGVGIAVASVAEESPASKAGLMQYDVLVRVNGEDIVGHQMLIDAVQDAGEAGRMLKMEFMRAGEMQDLELAPNKRDTGDRFHAPRSAEVTPEQENSFSLQLPENGQITPEWILEHLQRGGNQAELQEQINELRGQLENLQGELKDQSGDE